MGVPAVVRIVVGTVLVVGHRGAVPRGAVVHVVAVGWELAQVVRTVVVAPPWGQGACRPAVELPGALAQAPGLVQLVLVVQLELQQALEQVLVQVLVPGRGLAWAQVLQRVEWVWPLGSGQALPLVLQRGCLHVTALPAWLGPRSAPACL